MSEGSTLRLADVLYRTRGRDWDYAFLLQPAPLLSEGWYALHRRIFTNVEPAEVPVLLRGTLAIGAGHAFLATTFTDARRRDSQGRSVAHYITWLGPEAYRAPNTSFGSELVAALGGALDAVFDLVPPDVTRGSTKPLDALLRERFAAATKPTTLTLRSELRLAPRQLGDVAP